MKASLIVSGGGENYKISTPAFISTCKVWEGRNFIAEGRYDVESDVSSESLGLFMSHLNGSDIEINRSNVRDLKKLATEFGCSSLESMVSEFESNNPEPEMFYDETIVLEINDIKQTLNKQAKEIHCFAQQILNIDTSSTQGKQNAMEIISLQEKCDEQHDLIQRQTSDITRLSELVEKQAEDIAALTALVHKQAGEITALNQKVSSFKNKIRQCSSTSFTNCRMHQARFVIKNFKDPDYCLDAIDSSGENIGIWTRSGRDGKNQAWTYVNPGCICLHSSLGQKEPCSLIVCDGVPALVAGSTKNTATTKWMMTDDGYIVMKDNQNMCLSVKNGVIARGMGVVLKEKDEEDDSQRWLIELIP